MAETRHIGDGVYIEEIGQGGLRIDHYTTCTDRLGGQAVTMVLDAKQVGELVEYMNIEMGFDEVKEDIWQQLNAAEGEATDLRDQISALEDQIAGMKKELGRPAKIPTVIDKHCPKDVVHVIQRIRDDVL